MVVNSTYVCTVAFTIPNAKGVKGATRRGAHGTQHYCFFSTTPNILLQSLFPLLPTVPFYGGTENDDESLNKYKIRFLSPLVPYCTYRPFSDGVAPPPPHEPLNKDAVCSFVSYSTYNLFSAGIAPL